MLTGLYWAVEDRQLGDSQHPEDEVRKSHPILYVANLGTECQGGQVTV